MDDLLFKIWLGFGLFFIISEFLLPGLVMVFIGMGALTVSLGMYLGYADHLYQQFVIFFLSSVIYLTTLRFIILRFVPTSTYKEDIDEDHDAIGTTVEVVEDIASGGLGRVKYSESTWNAKSDSTSTILKGDHVEIIGRDNITWIVKEKD